MSESSVRSYNKRVLTNLEIVFEVIIASVRYINAYAYSNSLQLHILGIQLKTLFTYVLQKFEKSLGRNCFFFQNFVYAYTNTV